MRLAQTGSVAAVALCLSASGAYAATGEQAQGNWLGGAAVVEYASDASLRAVLRECDCRLAGRIPPLRTAVLTAPGRAAPVLARELARLPGVLSVERQVTRRSAAEPSLAPAAVSGGAYQWQYRAIGVDRVPEGVLRAAQAVTIAVVDTGADLGAPDLAAKQPLTYSVRTRSADVTDLNGHGTFVASLAAGSVTNDDGVAGAGGDAQLIVVQAGGANGSFTDVQEAAAIVYAVDRGAKIVNLSLGGPETSATERRAVDYAVSKGALLVAAVGNEYEEGNPVEYPAALLQPPGSHGLGGRGLAVAASTREGVRASFSNTGSHLSVAAPGQEVFGALSSAAPAGRYPRVPLPGAKAGLYGYASGTSFAAPQVSGVAALVWAANPNLTAQEVATIIEETASGRGAWNQELGYGVVDAAAAVARAAGTAPPSVQLIGTRVGRRVSLAWAASGAGAYRLSVAQNGGSERVLMDATTSTSASFSLAPGATYAFRVSVLDQAGMPTATSSPWTVSLLQAEARLTLAASRRTGRRPLSVRLTAKLRSGDSQVSPASRQVALESFDGKGWQRAARAYTGADGAVVWTFSLGPGSYKVRARFAGADDLAPATSGVVSLVVRELGSGTGP